MVNTAKGRVSVNPGGGMNGGGVPLVPPPPSWLGGALKVGSVGVVLATGALATIKYIDEQGRAYDEAGREVVPATAPGGGTWSPTGDMSPSTGQSQVSGSSLQGYPDGGKGRSGMGGAQTSSELPGDNNGNNGGNVGGGGGNVGGGGANVIGGGMPTGAPVSPITGQPRSAWSQALHDAMMNWVPGQSPHPLSPAAQQRYDPAMGQFVSTAPPPPEWNPVQNVQNGLPAGYPEPPFDQNGMLSNMQMPPNPAQQMAPMSQANPALPPLPAGQVASPNNLPPVPPPDLSGVPGNPAANMPIRNMNLPYDPPGNWSGMPPYAPQPGVNPMQQQMMQKQQEMMQQMTAGKYLDQLVNQAPPVRF